MPDIRIGDVVKLKSGGPSMTVDDIGDYSMDEDGTQSARCVWFDDKKKVECRPFLLSSLEKVDA